MDSKIYMTFIRKTVREEGIQVADKANKIALAQGRITQTQYSAAAGIIAKAYLEKA